MCRLPWAQTDRQTHSSESKHSAVAALKRSRDERTTTKITKTAVRIFATVSKAHGPWCVPQYTRCPCRVPTTALWATIPGLVILSIGARYIHGFGSRLVGIPESRQQKSLPNIQKVQKTDSHTVTPTVTLNLETMLYTCNQEGIAPHSKRRSISVPSASCCHIHSASRRRDKSRVPHRC